MKLFLFVCGLIPVAQIAQITQITQITNFMLFFLFFLLCACNEFQALLACELNISFINYTHKIMNVENVSSAIRTVSENQRHEEPSYPSVAEEQRFFSKLMPTKSSDMLPEQILVKSLQDYQNDLANSPLATMFTKTASLSPDDIMSIQSHISKIASNTEITTKFMSLASTSLNKLLSIQ